MSEYIDKEELERRMYHEAFEIDSDMQKWDSGCWIRYKVFKNVMEGIPPADVVEVVHCKDCKYQHKLGGRSGWCDRAVVDADDYVKGIVNANDDDYCSYGERGENG